MFCQLIWTALQIGNTGDIEYSEPERNAVNPNENTNQLAWRSFTGPPIQEQSQYPKFSSSETHGSRLQSANLAVSGHPATLQVTHYRHHERNSGPNGWPLELTGLNNKPRRVPEDDVSDDSTEYHTKSAAPHSSSEGEVTGLEFDWQLSALLAAQMLAAPTERDQRIAQLSDELEQVKADVAERARLELREYEDQLLAQTSLVKQRDIELVDMRASLRDMQAKLDGLLLFRDQQVGRYEKDLTNVRAKLEANESELEAVRLRLTDAEKSLTWSKAEAEALRAQTATCSLNRDEDQVTCRLMERVRAIEGVITSKRWNEKSIEEMECRNEG